MKLKVTEKILDYDNKPVVNLDQEGKPNGNLTWRDVIFVALNSMNTGTITGNKAIYESAYFFPSNLIFHYGTNTYPFPDFTNVLIFPSQVIFGFLVGWGIERLARKNKWFGLR